MPDSSSTAATIEAPVADLAFEASAAGLPRRFSHRDPPPSAREHCRDRRGGAGGLWLMVWGGTSAATTVSHPGRAGAVHLVAGHRSRYRSRARRVVFPIAAGGRAVPQPRRGAVPRPSRDAVPRRSRPTIRCPPAQRSARFTPTVRARPGSRVCRRSRTHAFSVAGISRRRRGLWSPARSRAAGCAA